MAISWYERLATPLILGGAVWLYGKFEHQSAGFNVFVRYFALWSAGIGGILFNHDLLDAWMNGLDVLLYLGWTATVGYAVWRRHLA